MRAGACPEGMNETNPPGYGRGKTDAIVGAKDIVIHGLRDGDHREPFTVQPLCEAQCVVSAYWDNGVNPPKCSRPLMQ